MVLMLGGTYFKRWDRMDRNRLIYIKQNRDKKKKKNATQAQKSYKFMRAFLSPAITVFKVTINSQRDDDSDSSDDEHGDASDESEDDETTVFEEYSVTKGKKAGKKWKRSSERDDRTISSGSE